MDANKYTSTWQTTDGERFDMRPLRPEDEPLLVAMYHDLDLK
jgi:hypothetical protein